MGDSDEGYADEYVLEDLEVTMADFVQRIMKGNFAAAWDELGPTNELEDTYELSSMKSLEEAVKQIVQYLGLQPCERSEKYRRERAPMHFCYQEFSEGASMCWFGPNWLFLTGSICN